MRKVERIEVDGVLVVTTADTSPSSRANIRAQVKAIAQKARSVANMDRQRIPQETLPLIEEQED